jgi:hypothetical protein
MVRARALLGSPVARRVLIAPNAEASLAPQQRVALNALAQAVRRSNVCALHGLLCGKRSAWWGGSRRAAAGNEGQPFGVLTPRFAQTVTPRADRARGPQAGQGALSGAQTRFQGSASGRTAVSSNQSLASCRPSAIRCTHTTPSAHTGIGPFPWLSIVSFGPSALRACSKCRSASTIALRWQSWGRLAAAASRATSPAAASPARGTRPQRASRCRRLGPPPLPNSPQSPSVWSFQHHQAARSGHII